MKTKGQTAALQLQEQTTFVGPCPGQIWAPYMTAAPSPLSSSRLITACTLSFWSMPDHSWLAASALCTCWIYGYLILEFIDSLLQGFHLSMSGMSI